MSQISFHKTAKVSFGKLREVFISLVRFVHTVKNAEHQCRFVLKVVIDSAIRNACLSRNILDGCRMKAFFGEHLCCSIKNLISPSCDKLLLYRVFHELTFYEWVFIRMIVHSYDTIIYLACQALKKEAEGSLKTC